MPRTVPTSPCRHGEPASSPARPGLEQRRRRPPGTVSWPDLPEASISARRQPPPPASIPTPDRTRPRFSAPAGGRSGGRGLPGGLRLVLGPRAGRCHAPPPAASPRRSPATGGPGRPTGGLGGRPAGPEQNPRRRFCGLGAQARAGNLRARGGRRSGLAPIRRPPGDDPTPDRESGTRAAVRAIAASRQAGPAGAVRARRRGWRRGRSQAGAPAPTAALMAAGRALCLVVDPTPARWARRTAPRAPFPVADGGPGQRPPRRGRRRAQWERVLSAVASRRPASTSPGRSWEGPETARATAGLPSVVRPGRPFPPVDGTVVSFR